MALVDMGLGAAILANLCTNGVAGRTSACVSMIIWDWKMKMWGNLGTGPGACALCGGWPRLSEGGLGDACGSMLVRSVLVAIIRAGPSGTCVLMVLRSVRLKCSSYWSHYFNFNFFFYKAKGLKQPVAGGGRAWWSPHLTKPFCEGAGGDLLPLLALSLEEGGGEQLLRSVLPLPWHCSCSPLLKPAVKPGSRMVDVHSALCFQNPVHGGVGSWRHPSPN